MKKDAALSSEHQYIPSLHCQLTSAHCCIALVPIYQTTMHHVTKAISTISAVWIQNVTQQSFQKHIFYSDTELIFAIILRINSNNRTSQGLIVLHQSSSLQILNLFCICTINFFKISLQ